ncbi:MAG: ComEC/Rec2 family competence protein [Bacteroidales bacterium]|nr:ComEC/Rec2 family competence protein [Bacteroidales bacterium]
MSWNDYPLVRLLAPFIFGILLASYIPMSSTSIIYFLFALLIVMFLMAYIPKFYPAYKFRFVSTGLIYLMFFVTGVAIVQHYFPYANSRYFGHSTDQYSAYIVKVVESPAETKKTNKVIIKVEKGISEKGVEPLLGKAILYLRKDSLIDPPKYGDYILIRNKLELIKPPSNPYSFDYQKYINRKGIQYGAFLKTDQYTFLYASNEFSLKNFASQIREKMLYLLEKSGLSGEEYAISASLLLGYQEALSDDLLTAYRSAGVMHILCVSGMHVGILYLLLSQLFSFLVHVKGGITIRLVIIILNIWIFAMITGLSPSVTRAAVMFTFVAIGKNIKRDINIYNTLASSAFLTLIFDPMSLYNIGFQLSYVAVIAIATFYKPIYSLWIPRRKVPDYLWQIMAVSLAAQLGTAPISMYYFHQFPNYFLFANIIVILLVTPIFYLAFITLIFSFWEPLSHLFAWLTSYSIKLMNYLVGFFQTLPYAITDGIHFGLETLFLLISLLIFLSVMFINKKKHFLFPSLIILILMFGTSIYQQRSKSNESMLVVFDTPGKLAMLIHHRKESVLLTDSITFANPQSIDFQISGYLTKYNLEPIWIDMDKSGLFDGIIYRHDNFVAFGNKIAVLTTNTKRWKQPVECDYLIVRDRNSFNYESLFRQYKPEITIASSELYPNQREKLREIIGDSISSLICTSEDGAFSTTLDFSMLKP